MTKNLHCIKCGHDWVPKEDGMKPARCPNTACRTTKWEGETPLPGRLPGLSQQEKDNAERKFIKAIKDPELMRNISGVGDTVIVAPPLTGTLEERMRATGKWEPQPMWDMEKELIRDYKAGMGGSDVWIKDFREWFMTAFNLYPDKPWSTHEKFVGRGDPRRFYIQERIQTQFGDGLKELVDTICDEVTKECDKWRTV